jgi:hypothetical protein
LPASADDVLSAKHEVFRSYNVPPAPAPAPPPGAQAVQPDNEKVAVENDEALGESNDIDAKFISVFPASISFLDLSSLEPQEKPQRFPLPLFLRREYHLFPELLQERPRSSFGSVIVNGQPGIGEILVFHILSNLTRRMKGNHRVYDRWSRILISNKPSTEMSIMSPKLSQGSHHDRLNPWSLSSTPIHARLERFSNVDLSRLLELRRSQGQMKAG